MVRFSDIIKSRVKKNNEKKQPETIRQEDGFRLSDSHAFKSRNSSTTKKGPNRRASSFETSSFYNAFFDRAKEISQWVKNDMQISPSVILADLHTVIERDLIDSLYEYAISAKNDNEYMSIHTVDVTFTSLKVGKEINFDIKMMLRLGLAAFLENVGMYKIPESILSNTGKLSDEDISLIRKHPETSRDILFNLGERYKWLAETALGTHERSDGSGYPSGLKNDEISELSSIIGLVDTYCAMIRNRPYRNKFIQTDAIKSIAETDKGKFPSRILRIFLNQVSLFPINSYVKLNNGSIGRVLSTERRHPLSPNVEILYGREGNKLNDKQEIALADNPLLYIDCGIDPDDLVN